jgi:hypothetical protein
MLHAWNAELGLIQTLRLEIALKTHVITKLKNSWSPELAKLAQSTIIQPHLIRMEMPLTACKILALLTPRSMKLLEPARSALLTLILMLRTRTVSLAIDRREKLSRLTELAKHAQLKLTLVQ